MLKQEFSGYSVEVKSLIMEIAAKYKQLQDLHPPKELVEYVNQLRKEVAIVLPEEELDLRSAPSGDLVGKRSM
ncbi:unnamed protein product [Hermetia illucens]|uniref:Uncharacterized protein n=1 Tax=Hermetia illucens TaxID=343691 RepID=A0A7R8UZH6_HERIL|nr:unnamed protein product [Hermetia illucens]